MDLCQSTPNQPQENFLPQTSSNSSSSSSSSNLARLDDVAQLITPLSTGNLMIEGPMEEYPIHNSHQLLRKFPAQQRLDAAPCLDAESLLSNLHQQLHGTEEVSMRNEDENSDDDLYSREAKAEATRSATSLAQIAAQNLSVKRPRSPEIQSPSTSPNRLEKDPSAQESSRFLPGVLLLTNGEALDSPRGRAKKIPAREVSPESSRAAMEAMDESVEHDRRPATTPEMATAPTTSSTALQPLEILQRRNVGSQTPPSPATNVLPLAAAVEAEQLRQLIREFRASLSQKMDALSLPLSHANLRPCLEGMTSTTLTALIGLEKSLQQLGPPSVATLPISNPLPTAPPGLAESPGIPRQPAPPTASTRSWAKVAASPLPHQSTQSTQQDQPVNPWISVGKTKSRSRAHQSNLEPGTGNRGLMPPHGAQSHRGPTSLPGRKTGVASGSSFVQELRATQMDKASPEERARALQTLLFATQSSDPAGAMDTETVRPRSSRVKSPDEPVTFLHVECQQFSAAARKEPKTAWRHLILSLAKEGSPRLRPLDILPMSATSAEIFLPESQLSLYREALQQYVKADPPPLSEKDFRRRAAAYRNSYYRAYRQATLRGFSSADLQWELLVYIQTEAYTPSPPPTKYPDIHLMIERDMKSLQEPLPTVSMDDR